MTLDSKTKKIIVVMILLIIIMTILEISYNAFYNSAYNNKIYTADIPSDQEVYTIYDLKWTKYYINPQHPEGITKESLFFINDTLAFIHVQVQASHFNRMFYLKHILGIEGVEYSVNNLWLMKKDSVYLMSPNRKIGTGYHITIDKNKLVIDN